MIDGVSLTPKISLAIGAGIDKRDAGIVPL
jgi:hypothetical protein